MTHRMNIPTAEFKPEPYWLLHHGELLEWTTAPVEVRLTYIREHKPDHEKPIRLRWLRKVQNPERLPAEVLQAGQKAADLVKRAEKAAHAYSLWEATRGVSFYGMRVEWLSHSTDVLTPAWLAYYEKWDKDYEQKHRGRAVELAAATSRRKKDSSLRAAAEVFRKHKDPIAALHREECPGCPFDYDRTLELILSKQEDPRRCSTPFDTA